MFTIDDIMQIAFFQVIYIILFIYLTGKEISRNPKTSLLWLMIAADVLYIAMLVWLTYTITTYVARSAADHFRWNAMLFCMLSPCLLILIVYTIYNVLRDVKYNRAAKQQQPE
jgi:hypothetical protein